MRCPMSILFAILVKVVRISKDVRRCTLVKKDTDACFEIGMLNSKAGATTNHITDVLTRATHFRVTWHCRVAVAGRNEINMVTVPVVAIYTITKVMVVVILTVHVAVTAMG